MPSTRASVRASRSMEMAEAAAQDYWSNHDGFEARWPLTFEILLPDGGLIGSAAVEMDHEPVFTAKPHNATSHRGAACGASGGLPGYAGD